MIEIENLRVERDGTPVLHDLSISLPAGGIPAQERGARESRGLRTPAKEKRKEARKKGKEKTALRC